MILRCQHPCLPTHHFSPGARRPRQFLPSPSRCSSRTQRMNRCEQASVCLPHCCRKRTRAEFIKTLLLSWRWMHRPTLPRCNIPLSARDARAVGSSSLRLERAARSRAVEYEYLQAGAQPQAAAGELPVSDARGHTHWIPTSTQSPTLCVCVTLCVCRGVCSKFHRRLSWGSSPRVFIVAPPWSGTVLL